MEGATLRTRLRQIKEHDILVAQEPPSPPTFTVPAFRARKHRGGESELLKDAYPSGFCRPPENRPLPTTTKTSTTSAGRSPPPLSGPRLCDLLHESKEAGAPPCGAAAGRHALNVTRVVVGAKDVVDTVGSELVQYAGFSIGPAEVSSPTSISGSHFPRPASPVSRVTIDGSALLGGRSSLLVEARSTVNQWSGRKTRAPGDFVSPRGESNAWKGRKRIRSATADRAQSSGGPEPWPYPAETLTGRSSSRSSTSATSASARGGGPGGAAAAAPRVNDSGDCEEPRAKPVGGEGCALRPVTRDKAVKYGVVAGGRDQSIRSPIDAASVVDQLDLPGPQENSRSFQEEEQAGCWSEMAETTEGELAPTSEEQPNGSGRRVDGAWAKKDKDYPSVWSDGAGDDDGDGDGDGDGSTGFVASVGTLDNDNDSTTVCDSPVVDGSAEQVAGKRSLSTLDTERYRGSLSKDATNILRSHLESRSKPPGHSASCVPDGRSAMATEGSAMVSPIPPPTPPGQHVGNFFAQGLQSTLPYYLPPLGRAAETCYVRTRSDIVLAVVRKKELLACDDYASLRTLKTAAYLVRIKAGMSMAEGVRAILASGVLEEHGAVDDCGRLVGGGAVDGIRSTRGLPRAWEYFNPQEGAWQLVRDESDWKILLAAQSSPQGAGVVFQAGGARGRGADFLVAVTPLETQQPSGRDKKSRSTAGRRDPPGKLRAALTRASKENCTGWRYASFVTPGALKSLAPSAHRDGSSSDRRAFVFAPYGAAGRDITETQTKGARHEGGGPATAGLVPFPGETNPETDPEAEDDDGDDDDDDDEFRRKLAGLDGARRKIKIGSGPGGALWMPKSKPAAGRGAAVSPSRRPKTAKVRRFVRHLEAGLKLKGRPGAGGLPPVGSQRVDLPYTKELAKWSYDEILGIPKTMVPAKPPES